MLTAMVGRYKQAADQVGLVDGASLLANDVVAWRSRAWCKRRSPFVISGGPPE